MLHRVILGLALVAALGAVVMLGGLAVLSSEWVEAEIAGATDFTIEGPATHGVPGLVNLFGIESPGLTASLAIAEEVLEAAGVAGARRQ